MNGEAEMEWKGNDWTGEERLGMADSKSTWIKPEKQPLVTFGQVFNRLTVIGAIDRSNPNHPKVTVQCSCGVKKLVLINSLKTGRTKSCGCLAKEQRRAGVAKSFERARIRKDDSAAKKQAKAGVDHRRNQDPA